MSSMYQVTATCCAIRSYGMIDLVRLFWSKTIQLYFFHVPAVLEFMKPLRTESGLFSFGYFLAEGGSDLWESHTYIFGALRGNLRHGAQTHIPISRMIRGISYHSTVLYRNTLCLDLSVPKVRAL